jgi:hypothetical protein
LTLNNEQIVALLEGYDKESKALKKEALTLAWYMRGGLSYEEAMYLSQSERETISKIIEGNMETTKKSGLPFF